MMLVLLMFALVAAIVILTFSTYRYVQQQEQTTFENEVSQLRIGTYQ